MRGRKFWFGSTALPGGPAIMLGLENWAAEQLGPTWNAIPWGWFTVCGLCIWIGYVIYDLTDDESEIRERLRRWRAVADIQIKTNRDNMIANPWQISATVKIKRRAENLGCYVRYGRPITYLNRGPKWEWSEQKTIIDGKDCEKGKIIQIPLAELEPKGSRLHLLDDEISLKESRFSNHYCLEVVVTARRYTQKEVKHFGFIKSDQPTFHTVHPDFMQGIEDE